MAISPVPNGPVTFPNGPGQPTDNLTALPSGQAMGLGAVGVALQQYWDDNVGPMTVTTGASVSGSGTFQLYLVVSEDGTHWTNGISPGAHSDQSALLTGLTPVPFTLSTPAASTSYVFPEFSVYQLLGYMPTFWTLVAYNQTGGALAASSASFFAQHNLINYPTG